MQKKNLVRLIGYCIVLLICAAGQLQAAENTVPPEYKNTISAARETLWKAITSGKGTGATIAVMDQGKIVYSEGIGTADRAQNRPVDKNTRFNIGSTSKMFAAVAILLLVDEGKVSLDESITKYIPEFTMKDERYKKITVRMLFNHSSGLPGSSFFFTYKPAANTHTLLLDTLKNARLKHDPGARSIYCNDGFTLAEIIVERISGKKFIPFLTERVFQPLGMKNTSASVGEINEPNVAEFYNAKTGKKQLREVVSVYGAGGLSSTAEDLCRFGDSFSVNGKRILSDASIREILKAQPTGFSDKLRGPQLLGQFGWEYSDLPGYRERGIQVLGKGGNTGSYSANLQIIPQERIVIGFALSGNIAGEILTRPILDALMKDRKLMEDRPKAAKKPADPQPIPTEMLKYAGYYANNAAVVKVAFDKKNNILTISPLTTEKADSAPPAPPLTFAYSNGYFHSNTDDPQCYFTTVDGTVFFASHKKPPYELDMVLYQKLGAIKKPIRLKENMKGKIWLLRNASPYMLGAITPDDSSTFKALPGYVELAGIKRIERSDFASSAATEFRDQTDLLLFSRNGKTWAKAGIFLLSTTDGIPNVKSGETVVRIGAEGYNEWLKVEKGALLSFRKPENGRIIVSNPEAVLFDSTIDSGEIYAPAGSYIFCAGAAGEVFRVHAK